MVITGRLVHFVSIFCGLAGLVILLIYFKTSDIYLAGKIACIF